jgi:hypothetical protein
VLNAEIKLGGRGKCIFTKLQINFSKGHFEKFNHVT